MHTTSSLRVCHAGGTPEWMAPEVLRSEKYAEPADVYSYGEDTVIRTSVPSVVLGYNGVTPNLF